MINKCITLLAILIMMGLAVPTVSLFAQDQAWWDLHNMVYNQAMDYIWNTPFEDTNQSQSITPSQNAPQRVENRVPFKIVNSTGYDINGIYISPISSDSWGSNLWASQDTFKTGYQIEFNVIPETYDIKIVNTNGVSYIKIKNRIIANSRIEFNANDMYVSSQPSSVPAAAPPAASTPVNTAPKQPAVSAPPANRVTLTVANATGYNVNGIYVSPSSSNNWGSNLWTSQDNFRTGFEVKFDVVSDTYNIRLVDTNGTFYEKNNFRITLDFKVTLTSYDKKSPTQSSSTPAAQPAAATSKLVGDYNSLHAKGYEYLYQRYLWANVKDPANLDKAIEYDEAAYTLYPQGNAAFELTQAYIARGILRYNNGNYALAIADFERCLSITPEYAETSSQISAKQYLQLAREKIRR